MLSKFACPTAATSSMRIPSRTLIRFGVTLDTVKAAAVDSAAPPFAFDPAVREVVIVALA